MSGVSVPSVSCPTLGAKDSAVYVGVREQTLASWRCNHPDRLPFIRVGRVIRYRIETLDRFLAANTVGGDSN